MLRLMLNRHPELAVAFESDFLAPLGRGVSRGPFNSPADAEHALLALASEPFSKKAELIGDPSGVLKGRPRNYAELIRMVMASYASRRGKHRWGMKAPGYNARLDEVFDLLPDAKVIHIVRDGRDVAVSNRKVSWGSRHTPRIARDWRWKVMLGRKTGRMLARQYREVKYESLVVAPAETLALICEFLGLQYDAGMLDYHLDARFEMPPSSMKWHESSISAPDARKVGAWRTQLPPADVQLFQEEAGDALEAFGYELVPVHGRLSVAVRHAYYAMVHRW
jgi:hypothetical protein